jgi:hypothetical protein
VPLLAHNKCPLSRVQNPSVLTLGVDSFLGARSHSETSWPSGISRRTRGGLGSTGSASPRGTSWGSRSTSQLRGEHGAGQRQHGHLRHAHLGADGGEFPPAQRQARTAGAGHVQGAWGRAAIAPKPMPPNSRRLALRILSPSLLIFWPEPPKTLGPASRRATRRSTVARRIHTSFTQR